VRTAGEIRDQDIDSSSGLGSAVLMLPQIRSANNSHGQVLGVVYDVVV
jgi:hypothetical protein